MKINLQTAPCYPFHLDGPLCPLLNRAELLTEFYAEESLRHGIKQYCKKNSWPGKPVVSFAISPEKLQELMFSLFNTPSARANLQRQSADGRVMYLDNAIWRWLTVTHPQLAEKVSDCCVEIKGKIFLEVEPLQKLVAALLTEKPDAVAVTALAYGVLAFAMLQPNDRYRLGEIFLSAFPDEAERFCGAERKRV